MTPNDFGLCVRSHPQSLIVTARNKMRTGTQVLRQINLDGRLIETSVLLSAPTVLEFNLSLLRSIIDEMNEYEAPLESKGAGGYIWKSVPVDSIQTFVRGFQNHPAAMLTSPEPVLEYITRLQSQGMQTWNVLLATLEKKSQETEIVSNLEIHLPRRKVAPYHGSGIEFNKRRVGEAKEESAGLPDEEVAHAEQDFLGTKSPKNVPGAVYRRLRERLGANPLLILHLLDCHTDGVSKLSENGVAAYGISFPGESGSRRPERLVEYVVNTVWWRNEFQYLIEEDDEVENE